MTYKFISWNIDSLNAALTSDSARSQMSRDVLLNLAAQDPDVLVIQETKLPATGPSPVHAQALSKIFPDYMLAWTSSQEPARKGYAGTLTLYKHDLPDPEITFPKLGAPEPMDDEGRIITLEFPDFYLTQVYTPNAGAGLRRLDERGDWDDKYRDYLSQLDKEKPVIAAGDYNVAHEEIDLANPASNHQSPGFTDQEREKFTRLLKAGFTDTFRYVNGNVKEVYSWWAQRSKTAKINNTGWRIDYWLVSNRVADQVIKSEMIDSGPRQDHTPILLEIDI